MRPSTSKPWAGTPDALQPRLTTRYDVSVCPLNINDRRRRRGATAEHVRASLLDLLHCTCEPELVELAPHQLGGRCSEP